MTYAELLAIASTAAGFVAIIYLAHWPTVPNRYGAVAMNVVGLLGCAVYYALVVAASGALMTGVGSMWIAAAFHAYPV